MKVYVFGSSGMLGRYVTKFLEENKFNVQKLNRNSIDISNITEIELQSNLSLTTNDVVINCAGAIKPRVDELGELNALSVNSVFPYILANVCEKFGSRMIHISTDGVFSGKNGNYLEDDTDFTSDFYGLTKLMGEPKNCMVMRVCPIGEEIGQSRSLLEWIKSCKDKSANGFTNHIWNGLTALQVAKVIKQIINRNIKWDGVRHIFSPNPVSKAKLLNLVNDTFRLSIDINEMESSVAIDRSLNSSHNLNLNIPDIEQQIKDIKGYL